MMQGMPEEDRGAEARGPEGGGSAATMAAVDLGSNSFHLLIGRELEGELSILDRLRDPVRLADGLADGQRLEEATVARMVASLERFRQRLAGVPRERTRAIGTNTFRLATEPPDLLERAEAALGLPIEVLSGPEEARLIYLGVSHDRPATQGWRLVIDIGGGSTECILGRGFQARYTDSLQMGCVGFTKRFFAGGALGRREFQRATIAAKLELETIVRRYRNTGWTECVGSSGTINAVSAILLAEGWSKDGEITLAELKRLRKQMTAAERLEALQLPSLQDDRRPVLAAGVAILEAVFESLGIETMLATRSSIREGVLYDLLGRIRHEDVRDRSIRSLSEGYHVDRDQALRVARTALVCLDAVGRAWKLDADEDRRMLEWAARVHEIGLAIAYSGHHKHGAYILANATMPGFSRQEQLRLSVIVREHRRKLSLEAFAALPRAERERAQRLCVLLRLAVRLNRTRSSAAVPRFELAADGSELSIELDEAWLAEHPLTRADLEDEDEILARAGYRLKIRERAAADLGRVS